MSVLMQDAPPEPRLEILPSGTRVIRLGPDDGPAWLREYDWILRRAAEDFLKRSKVPGIPEGVLARLREALDDPDRQAVWLVLDPTYRLVGFAWVRLQSLFGGPPVALCPAAYLYPKKSARAAFPALVARMRAWAHAQGATHHYFESRRDRPRAWARIGARPEATIYGLPTAVEEPA